MSDFAPLALSSCSTSTTFAGTASTSSMSTSLRRSASVRNSRSIATVTPLQSKRSSAYLFGTPVGDWAVGEDNSSMRTDENAGLRRTVETQQKQINSLRGRIADLERYLERGTSDEVERLSKELSTLEELFAQTQRDNENKHAEGERQKLYVKELENLLNISLGTDWRTDHDLHPPVAPSLTVTSSTPLPKPKPAAQLRHSASVAHKRTASISTNNRRRASSAMDLSLISLHAVKEVAEQKHQNGATGEEGDGSDDTPTGALRRLNGIARDPIDEAGDTPTVSISPSQQNANHLSAAQALDMSTTRLPQLTSAPKRNTFAETSHSDPRLDTIINLLSSLDPSALPSSAASRSKAASSSSSSDVNDRNREGREELARSRQNHVKLMKRMFEEQERRLAEREARLVQMIAMARTKEAEYAMLA